MGKHTKHQVKWILFSNMRLIVMLVTSVCVLFLLSYDEQRKRVFTILDRVWADTLYLADTREGPKGVLSGFTVYPRGVRQFNVGWNKDVFVLCQVG